MATGRVVEHDRIATHLGEVAVDQRQGLGPLVGLEGPVDAVLKGIRRGGVERRRDARGAVGLRLHPIEDGRYGDQHGGKSDGQSKAWSHDLMLRGGPALVATHRQKELDNAIGRGISPVAMRRITSG